MQFENRFVCKERQKIFLIYGILVCRHFVRSAIKIPALKIRNALECFLKKKTNEIWDEYHQSIKKRDDQCVSVQCKTMFESKNWNFIQMTAWRCDLLQNEGEKKMELNIWCLKPTTALLMNAINGQKSILVAIMTTFGFVLIIFVICEYKSTTAAGTTGSQYRITLSWECRRRVCIDCRCQCQCLSS